MAEINTENNILVGVKIPKDIVKEIKVIAIREEKKIMQVYEEALENYIKSKKSSQSA